MAEKTIIYKDGKDTGEAVGPDENYLPWITRQGAIGIAETPGSFATLYGLGRAGAEYLWDRKGGPTDTEGKPVGKSSFHDYMLDPEGGKEKLDAYNQKVFEDIARARPGAKPEEIQKRFEEIQKHSKRYFEETTPFYRSGVAFGRRWGQKTNEALGDERLPHEKTQADQLVNIAGGAAVPIPGKFILGPVEKGLSAVAGKTAGKIGTYAAEVATPATIIPKGATGGEIATRMGLNVAVPATVDQVVRANTDQPSVMGDAISGVKDFYTKDDGSAEVERIGATGLIGTVIAGLAARRAAHLIAPKVHPPSAGPTSQAMTEAINPTIDPNKMRFARAGSEVEPFKMMAKEMEVPEDGVTAYMTSLHRDARGMPLADHAIWKQQKLSPVIEQFAKEDPDFVNKAMQHFADKYREWGDTEAMTRTTKLLTDAQDELLKAQRSGRSTPQRIQKLTDEVNTLQAEQTMRHTDADPNLRHSLMNDDRATVQARLRQSSQDPKIRKMEQDLHRLYDSSFDDAAASGVMSAAEARRAKMEVRKGNYHLTDNPLAQKTWMERTSTKLKDAWSPHLVNSDPSAVLGLYRAGHERVRKGYINSKGESRYSPAPGFEPHPRVNNPRDPFSELAFMDIRHRQAASANRAHRDYTEMMMQAPKNVRSGRKYLDIEHVYSEKEIPSVINKIEKEIADSNKREKGPFTYAYRGEQGSLVVVKHNEKHIQELLGFAPAAVVPVLNGSRKLATSLMTGAGNPKFGLAVSNVYDLLAGSFLRHKSTALGPFSYMAHRMFGMGSMKARIVSGIMSTPDAAINVFASYPYYLIKATLSEFVGNHLAKKWEAALANNTGIGKIPGVKQVLGPVAKAMSDAYDTSMTNLTKTMKAGHVANGSDDILALMRQTNAITLKRPAWKSGANQYLNMLQVWMDVPKHMFLSQNLKLMKHEMKKGRQLAKYMSEEFIADQARMVGGDMARISGSPAIQRIVSMMPWLNPNIQSMRYLKQRIMENPVENIGRLMSFGLVGAFAIDQVAKTVEGNDWYFNQLPNDIRLKNLPFPNPYRYIARQMGMNIPQGTPEQENVLIPVPPEMMVLLLPIIHGMRALGLVSNPNTVVPQSLGDDMKHARDQVFGLATPPDIQSVLSLYGKKFEPGKMLGGENPVRDIRDPNFGGANKDKMSPQSRIPHAYYDAFTAKFGVVLGTMLEAADVATIHTQTKGGTLEKGLAAGAEKLKFAAQQQVPLANHIWPEMNRRYIYTPIAEKRQHDMSILKNSVEAQMQAEAGLRRALAPNARPNTLEKTDVAPGAVVGSPVGDPTVRAILAQVHMTFFAGPYLKLEEQRKVERSRHEAMTIGTDPSMPNESPLSRFQAAQEQAKKVNALDRQLYTIYSDQWKIMKTSPNGKAFEAKYGPLTPENLAKALQESSRQQGFEKPR